MTLNHPDPRVQKWLERANRRPPETHSRTTNRTLRQSWWGYREGLVLYFFNHIVNRLPSHRLRLMCYRPIITIGQNSSILMGLQLYYPGRIIIGTDTAINNNCVFDSRAGIKIGNRVSISPYVQIWSGGHDINSPDFASYGGLTLIEDYVWVASGAIITGGTAGLVLTLGEGCVVTAGSVVVRDVEPYTVVAGNPARKIATRSRDLDYKLNHFPPFR